MDSMRDSLRSGYTLDELRRLASAIQERDDRGAAPAVVREVVDERGDWFGETLLRSAAQYHKEEKKNENEDLKNYIKTHIKAYLLPVDCMLGAILCIQVLFLVRLFGGF
jgi:hypothetical protein